MKILRIEYCTSWGYLARAVALAEDVLNEHKNNIEEIKLVPSTGGVYEISFNEKLIFSKKNLERFPEDGEVENLINKELEKYHAG